jgi:hypothetical protein
MENLIHPSRRLGKGPAVLPAGLHAFSDYVDRRKLPVPPDSVNNSGELPGTPMFANDKIGNCTCAAIAHQARAWMYANGGRLKVHDDDVIALYQQFGYVPSLPDTDNGAVEAEVLRYWHRNPQFGTSLDAMASVNPRSMSTIRNCVYLMGGCYIGVDLPRAVANLDHWPDPPNRHGDWAPGSWGGHAVVILDYDRDAFTCVSWGKFLPISPAFMLTYCTEAWALLSDEWADANGAPNGMEYSALKRDMALLDRG